MRINARLDENRSQKLRYLTRTTQRGVSDVIKQAIDLYYDQVKSAQPSAAAILEQTGLIGCMDAEPEFSARYKDELTRILEDKHGHR